MEPKNTTEEAMRLAEELNDHGKEPCALKPDEGWAQYGNTRVHQFTTDACGGDAELICLLQKAMERFTDGLKYGDVGPVNAAAVAEWFYAKYGNPTTR